MIKPSWLKWKLGKFPTIYLIDYRWTGDVKKTYLFRNLKNELCAYIDPGPGPGCGIVYLESDGTIEEGDKVGWTHLSYKNPWEQRSLPFPEPGPVHLKSISEQIRGIELEKGK